MSSNNRPRFIGDVAKATPVKVEPRAGNLVANLQALGEHMKVRNQLLNGAALQFEDGQSVVLLSGADAKDRRLVITKTGIDRYEIVRDGAEDVRVDEVETAFLRLKINQFVSGKLKLSAPMDAKAWKATMRQRLEAAEKALKAKSGRLAEA